MDYLTKFKDAALAAATAATKAASTAAATAAEKAKSMTISVKLTDDILNKAIGNIFGEEREIQSVTLAVHDGWFQAKAQINHGLVAFDVIVEFEVLHFEVNKNIQIIELRQRNVLKTDALGWRNKVTVYVIKAIISAFTGKSLLQWGLKGTNGITVNKDLISIDLSQTGAKEALFAAIAEKVGQSATSFLGSLVQGSAEKLVDNIGIKSATCTDGALMVNVALLTS